MHTSAQGKAGSTRPPIKAIPEWFSMDKKEVSDLVVKLGKEGKTSSEIGVVLRDQYGVPLVSVITGKKVTAILSDNKLAGDIPEDLLNLIRKAVGMRAHLKENKKDNHSKHNLMRVESKVKRLVKYYRRVGKLTPTWRYSPENAALLVR